MAAKSTETLPAPRPPTAPVAETAAAPPSELMAAGESVSAGCLAEVLPKDEIARIHELFSKKLPLEWIAIKPTGEIYLPQVFYRRLLLEAFGPGNWRMRPLEGYQMPKCTKVDGGRVQVIWPMELVAYNRVVGLGIGEASYYEGNARSSMATAAESAHSDAITRAAKTLGIATECWDPVFARWFVDLYCVRVWVVNWKGKKEMQWRRKDSPPLPGEKAEAPMDERPGQVIDRPESTDEPVGAGKAPTREPGEDDVEIVRELFDIPADAPTDPRDRTSPYIVQEDIKTLMAVCNKQGVTDETLMAHLWDMYAIESRKDIRRVWFPAILEWVKRQPPTPKPGRTHARTVRR